MSNVKITDLAAYDNPDSTDVLPIVDVGADVTKKVSIADLLKNAGSGSAADPGIAFDGDNTGIYRPGPDQLALATNGTERVEFGTGEVVFNDGGANYDFRIEGDTEANLFFVDASTDRVAIGNTSPGGALEIDAAAATPPFIAKINTSEAARIDSDGRFLVGTSSASQVGNANASLQIEGTTNNDASLSIRRITDGVGGSYISIGKARGTTGTPVIVNDDDTIGTIQFAAYDGADFNIRAAEISAEVDGIPGANDIPGRLVFSVTADGASIPTEAMRIKNSRIINIANAPVYADNAAAKTGGLVDGDVYRTSTGDLKIVYT